MRRESGYEEVLGRALDDLEARLSRTERAPLTPEFVTELTGLTDPRVVREVQEDAARIAAATGVPEDQVAPVLGRLGHWDLAQDGAA